MWKNGEYVLEDGTVTTLLDYNIYSLMMLMYQELSSYICRFKNKGQTKTTYSTKRTIPIGN